ncbi:MAG: class I SAM-dependent methyltransferase [Rhodobacteraceae bacterium]|nr:class I SAM-dependent methyltransferase [Paracoccaceae bacterium]
MDTSIAISGIDDDPYLKNHLKICPDAIQAKIDSFAKAPGTIVDFGCGHGIKTIAMALRYPDAQVIGFDITDAHRRAQDFCKNRLEGGMPKNLRFQTVEPGTPLSQICQPDVIYSWSVLEHVSRKLLPAVLTDMFDALRPDGAVITQIAPLYFSPFGSHLKEFSDIKWIHLLESHEELRNRIYASPKSQGATGSAKWMFSRYEDLNRITAEELSQYFQAAGFSALSDERKTFDGDVPAPLLATYAEPSLRTFELNFVHGKSPLPQKRGLWPGRGAAR